MTGTMVPVLLLAAGGLFAAFCWAARFHFRANGVPSGMKLISAASLLAFAAFVGRLLLRGSGSGAGVALALMAASAALFAWALRSTRLDPPNVAFSATPAIRLFRHGPYRLMRHPFYTSYLLFWTATCLAAPGPSGWVALAILAMLYIEAVRREESEFAHSLLSGAYESYRRTTGAFLPRPSSLLWLGRRRADS